MPQPELDIGFFQEHPFPQQIVGAEIPASGSASRDLVLSSIMTFLLHNLCHTSNFTLPSVLLCLIFAFPPDCELLCSLFFFFCFNLHFPWTEEPGRLQSVGHKESDMTERLHRQLTFILCVVS